MREILVYGIIGDEWDGLTAAQFKQQLNEAVADPECTEITVKINSPGGYVSEGLAIVNSILACEKPVHTVNEGFAFSMAAPILFAGSTVSAAKNSLILIHNAWGMMVGDAQDLEGELENIKKIDQVLAQSIADRTGQTLDEIQAKFFDYKDHTLTADEAQAENMIDEILDYESAALKNFKKDVRNLTRDEVFNHFKKHNKGNAQEGHESLITSIVSRVAALVKPQNQKPEKMNFELLSAKLDKAENGTIELNEQEIQDLKAEIQAAKKDGDVITDQDLQNAKAEAKQEAETELKDAHTKEIETKDEKIQGLEKEIQGLEKEIQDLKEASAGGGNGLGKKEGNDDDGGEGEKSFSETVANLSHNKKADSGRY